MMQKIMVIIEKDASRNEFVRFRFVNGAEDEKSGLVKEQDIV